MQSCIKRNTVFSMEFLRSAWAFAFSFSLAFSLPENGSVFAIRRKVFHATKNRLQCVSGLVFVVLVVARCHAQKYFFIPRPIKRYIIESKHLAIMNIVCKWCLACVFQYCVFVGGYSKLSRLFPFAIEFSLLPNRKKQGGFPRPICFLLKGVF